MPSGVGDIGHIERVGLPELSLDSEAPTIDRRGLIPLVESPDVHGKTQTGGQQTGRKVADLAWGQLRSVQERRVAQGVKIVHVLSNALKKRPQSSAYRGFAVPQGIKSKAEAWRYLVLMMFSKA